MVLSARLLWLQATENHAGMWLQKCEMTHRCHGEPDKVLEEQEPGKCWESWAQEECDVLNTSDRRYQGQPFPILSSHESRAPCGRAGHLDWKLFQDHVEQGEGNRGVPWQIPLAGQTNIYLHLLSFCMFPLSRLIQPNASPSTPSLQEEAATYMTQVWPIRQGVWGERVLEKLFVSE